MRLEFRNFIHHLTLLGTCSMLQSNKALANFERMCFIFFVYVMI